MDKLTDFYNSKAKRTKPQRNLKNTKKRIEELIKEMTQYQVEGNTTNVLLI